VGTSVNQSSPRTLGWSAAQAGYRDIDIPIARVNAEIWRAALNQEKGNIAALLAEPIIARLGVLAARAKSAADASRITALELSRSKQSSLGTDIARRAAIQSVQFSNRAEAFTERLFSEVTAYLVSRDLPGFVGSGRAETVRDSAEFQSAIKAHTADLTRGIKVPSRLTAKSWERYVSAVVNRLRGFER